VTSAARFAFSIEEYSPIYRFSRLKTTRAKIHFDDAF